MSHGFGKTCSDPKIHLMLSFDTSYTQETPSCLVTLTDSYSHVTNDSFHGLVSVTPPATDTDCSDSDPAWDTLSIQD